MLEWSSPLTNSNAYTSSNNRSAWAFWAIVVLELLPIIILKLREAWSVREQFIDLVIDLLKEIDATYYIKRVSQNDSNVVISKSHIDCYYSIITTVYTSITEWTKYFSTKIPTLANLNSKSSGPQRSNSNVSRHYHNLCKLWDLHRWWL